MKIPNYQKIYEDLLRSKGLEGTKEVPRFEKSTDIIRFDNLISDKNNEGADKENQRFRAYDEESVLEILTYQKKYRLNNSELARIFRLSRNTIAR
ncbi:hypothetical protein HNP38_000823 [Chryseobacterium defluvii]|uniref:Uncharacterized protein n=1 Tax=Chryseobacterium defluvii TaxID=160396 RepID=A0A840K7R6_9FLAO|nr:helix-turn-helix domain-containing protein [Chryseobacterium defluvii]MBB4805551.1 hypothetical protein [Chryseobacterium defluvii]